MRLNEGPLGVRLVYEESNMEICVQIDAPPANSSSAGCTLRQTFTPTQIYDVIMLMSDLQWDETTAAVYHFDESGVFNFANNF